MKIIETFNCNFYLQEGCNNESFIRPLKVQDKDMGTPWFASNIGCISSKYKTRDNTFVKINNTTINNKLKNSRKLKKNEENLILQDQEKRIPLDDCSYSNKNDCSKECSWKVIDIKMVEYSCHRRKINNEDRIAEKCSIDETEKETKTAKYNRLYNHVSSRKTSSYELILPLKLTRPSTDMNVYASSKTWFTCSEDINGLDVKEHSDQAAHLVNENAKMMERQQKMYTYQTSKKSELVTKMYCTALPKDKEYIRLRNQWLNERSSLCPCDSDSQSGNTSGKSFEKKQSGSGDTNPSDGRERHHRDKEGGTGNSGDGSRRSNNGNGNGGQKNLDGSSADDENEDEIVEENEEEKPENSVAEVAKKQNATGCVERKETELPSPVLVATVNGYNDEEWKSHRKKEGHHVEIEEAFDAMGLLRSPDCASPNDLSKVLGRCDYCFRDSQRLSDSYSIDINSDEEMINCLLCDFLSELIQHASKCQTSCCQECQQILLVVQHHVIACNGDCDVNVCSHLLSRFPGDQPIEKETEFLDELKCLLRRLLPLPRPGFDEMPQDVIKSLELLSISEKQKKASNRAAPLYSPPFYSGGSVFTSGISALSDDSQTPKPRRPSTNISQLPSIQEGGVFHNESTLVSRGILNDDEASGILENRQYSAHTVSPSLRMAGQQSRMLSVVGRPRSQSIPAVPYDLRRQALMSCTNEQDQLINSIQLPQNDQNQSALSKFLYDETKNTEELGSGIGTQDVARFSSLPQEALVRQSGRTPESFSSLRGPLGQPCTEPAGATSLPVRRPSSLGSFSKSRRPGIGQVDYGVFANLTAIALQWTYLKSQWERKSLECVSHREEGIIFQNYQQWFRVNNTYYQEGQHWFTSTHLGSGVAGKCFLATDDNTRFQFCAKKIHISNYHENELLQWSQLDHPGIVKLYGAIRIGETLVLFMEYVAGGTLAAFINEHKRLNQWQSLHYLKQILHVLIYLQQRRILHEDLKADNILIHADETLRIAVTDFGLAHYLEDEDRVPPDERPVGAQTQWSPEKAASEGHDFRSDLWAAVCVLVHMLSGEHPWVRRFGNAAMLHFIIRMNSPPFEDVPDNLHHDITALIHWGWTEDWRQRPFADELVQHRAFQLLHLDVEDPTLATNLASIYSSETESTIQSLQHMRLQKENNEIQAAYHSFNVESPAEILQEVMGTSENDDDCKRSSGSASQESLKELLENFRQELLLSDDDVSETEATVYKNIHDLLNVAPTAKVEGNQLNTMLSTDGFIASDDDLYQSGDNKIDNNLQVGMASPSNTNSSEQEAISIDLKSADASTVSMTKLIPASVCDLSVEKQLSVVIDPDSKSTVSNLQRRNSELVTSAPKHLTLTKSKSTPAVKAVSSPSPDKNPNGDSGYTTGSAKRTPSSTDPLAFPAPEGPEMSNDRMDSTSVVYSNEDNFTDKADDLVDKTNETVAANLFSPPVTSTPQKNGSPRSEESPILHQKERRSFHRAVSHFTLDEMAEEELMKYTSAFFEDLYSKKILQAQNAEDAEDAAKAYNEYYRSLSHVSTFYLQPDTAQPTDTKQNEVQSDIPGVSQDELDHFSNLFKNETPDPEKPQSKKVVFKNLNEQMIAKIAYSDPGTIWKDIVQGASSAIHSAGYQEFVVKHKDRSLVNLDVLVDSSTVECEVLVTVPDEDSSWTVNDNQININWALHENQGIFEAVDPEDVHPSQWEDI